MYKKIEVKPLFGGGFPGPIVPPSEMIFSRR